MEGWLVINSFMENDKFKHLYEMLLSAFAKRDVILKMKKASDLSLEVGEIIKEKPAFIIFWDKDIYLAERLEEMGFRLFNNKEAIALCDNKILMYQKLEAANIRIPRTFIAPKTFTGLGYNDLSFLKKVSKEIGYPMVIKEAYGSFGEQVYLASDEKEAINIIKNINDKDFLMQEYIASSKGRDVRLNVVGGKVIVSMLRENQNDFRSNISSGGKGHLYEPDEDFKKMAIKACEALNLDFAGVDIMFDKNQRPILCEVNSNPQFASTLKATGVDLSNYIADYILDNL